MTEKQENVPLLDFADITVVKDGRLILDHISIRVEAEESIAIIGPNGSGKSSLIKVMTREYYPVAGVPDLRMNIMGEEMWNIFDLRKRLGIITTDLQYACIRDNTVLETVISGYFSSIGIYDDFFDVTIEMKAMAHEVLKFLGIHHLANQKMTKISSGEARKTLIARALVHDPKALVLDEPTNSLDMKSIDQFRKTVSAVAAAGKNIVLVTHDLSDIIPEIKRVVLIKDGKIFADGKKEDILTDENLTALFDIPVKVQKHGEYYAAFC
ncbi:putative ABC transporter ATP-binding protein YlmA [Methanimicrococcus sp. At1]|uniref:ABC transporter ATP-binding protein YlmA n=1 Tax=Methanimicrococcus hacksteinii TaxID=3028293 RepID=A0ABU3VQN5_9EURY|nr:ATP-binding cassette domain-containing protein [Methanimicrococcus sp. At1]MDV0445725.1 putative ABC transporter ATP-binding protein YlmA [Methanimicrococcus sp. At1]